MQRAICLLASSLTVLPACVGPPPAPVRADVTLQLGFDTPARAAAAIRIDVEVFRGSCGSGPVVLGPLELRRADAGMEMGMSVEADEYCVRATAYDRSCVSFAGGERRFATTSTMTVDVELTPVDASRECIAAACIEGRCMASLGDAGVDAPMYPDNWISPEVSFFEDTPPGDAGPPDDLGMLGSGCRPGFPTALTAGRAHTCALFGTEAHCWGEDVDGRLGAGVVRSEGRVPVAVVGGLAFNQLTAGGSHTCGLVAGRAYCWGDNRDGQLGIGRIDGMPHPAPEAVATALTFTSIAAGERHTCGVAGNPSAMPPVPFTVVCWGANDLRQLGTASPGPAVGMPQPVTGFPASTAPSAVDVGANHACAILNTAGGVIVSCFGQPGPWAGSSTGPPATVFEPPAAVSVFGLTLGAQHACLLQFDTSLMVSTLCWGSGGGGRLGTGTATDRPSPVATSVAFNNLALGGVVSCESAPRSTTGIFSDLPYFVRCYGSGATGATGPRGQGRDALTPVIALEHAGSLNRLTLFPTWNAPILAAGTGHTCATAPDGLVCWGDNTFGQLGTGAGADIVAAPMRVCF